MKGFRYASESAWALITGTGLVVAGVLVVGNGALAQVDVLYETRKLHPSDGGGFKQFGEEVDIDGDTALIVSRDHSDAADVYVFTRDGSGQWTEQEKIVAPPDIGDRSFGRCPIGSNCAAIDGDTALIGGYNNIVSVFVRDEFGRWTEQDRLQLPVGWPVYSFGQQVAMDGDTALIGDMHYTNPRGLVVGSAYVFTRNGTDEWALQEQLLGSDSGDWEWFGSSLALDGQIALVGAAPGRDRCAAYVFRQDPSGRWVEEAKLLLPEGSGFEAGFPVDVGVDTAMIGFGGVDGVYVFARDSTGDWHEQTILRPPESVIGSAFGYSIGLDGDSVLVGARGEEVNGVKHTGSAYVFTRDSLGRWAQNVKLIASDGG